MLKLMLKMLHHSTRPSTYDKWCHLYKVYNRKVTIMTMQTMTLLTPSVIYLSKNY